MPKDGSSPPLAPVVGLGITWNLRLGGKGLFRVDEVIQETNRFTKLCRIIHCLVIVAFDQVVLQFLLVIKGILKGRDIRQRIDGFLSRSEVSQRFILFRDLGDLLRQLLGGTVAGRNIVLQRKRIADVRFSGFYSMYRP